MNYEIIAESNESTVVAEFHSDNEKKSAYESEAELERAFMALLQKQGYEFKNIHKEQELKDNLKEQLEKLNDYHFTPKEWDTLYSQFIANKNDDYKAKTRKIQEDPIFNLTLENGKTKNIKIIDKKNIHKNALQVIRQYSAKGEKYENRYDVSVLVNGLPLVHVELKRRGVAIREAFNQIKRYKRDSFSAEDGLFEFVQIFVISNGTSSKYYSNTTRIAHLEKNHKADTFEFTNYWADSKNNNIEDLMDFARSFFAKHSLLNVLTRYCVFTSDEVLLVMRPYQIVAAERILEKIKTAQNSKTKNQSKGFIWHTTGSGKTLTSFKSAVLAKELESVSKVLFVVDRKDLDYQTMKEYDKFQKDCANSNTSTKILKEQLENPNAKIIITTIQKLDKFVKSHFKGHAIFNEEVVMIFDECHRSQLGSMHQAITKAFKKYHLFGFTGTPIFAQNCDKNNPLGTTEQKFGNCLHQYTIIDAIRDKNVLPFRVEYHNTIKAKEGIIDNKVRAVDEKNALLDTRRIKEIAKCILERFNQATKNKKFNSILACSSIEALKKYYLAFKEEKHDLKIATIFSYSANEEFDALEDENNESVNGLDKSSRDFLEGAIADYNKMFKTSFDTSDQKFQSYYKDLSQKVKDREIDLLMVVNMFLTGFDATRLNTLWVDKNLKYHGLIQAFSRANRILDSVKTHGNIVCFRDLEQDLNDALMLFGNKDAQSIALLRKYEDYLKGYTDNNKEYEGYESLIGRLLREFPLKEPIISESQKKDFIKLFGKILKLENILNSFESFKKDDYINPRDFQDYQINGFFCKIKESLRRLIMLKELRQKRPLVHNITNYVVAQFVANGLLALGASPLMSDAIAEMQDLAKISDALAINIGTLNERTILCAKEAIKHYKALNKPIVLDPVGCSASALRHDTSLELLKSGGISTLRGNAAELGSLVGISCGSKGLDSHCAITPIEIAKLAAQKYSVIAVMTGKTDYVSDGKKVLSITGGSEYLALITGAGCLHTAACTSFLSLKKDPLDSMVQLCALYKQAAFNAQKKVLENNGSNGSFLFYFLDALSLPIELENSLIKEEL